MKKLTNKELNTEIAYKKILNFVHTDKYGNKTIDKNILAVNLANKYLAKLPTNRDYIQFNLYLKCMLNACNNYLQAIYHNTEAVQALS